jgi:NTE family protein
MFQAEQIDGDFYWDGGYVGNPTIWPLTYNCESRDIVIVEINPIVRKDLPDNGKEIINRLNEISFNTSLIAEMRAVNFVNKLIEQKHLVSDKYRKTNIHLIASTEEMLSLNASSKMNASMEFFEYLHELGRQAAGDWIKANFNMIGVDSSVDIEEAFLAHTKKPAPIKGEVTAGTKKSA